MVKIQREQIRGSRTRNTTPILVPTSSPVFESLVDLINRKMTITQTLFGWFFNIFNGFPQNYEYLTTAHLSNLSKLFQLFSTKCCFSQPPTRHSEKTLFSSKRAESQLFKTQKISESVENSWRNLNFTVRVDLWQCVARNLGHTQDISSSWPECDWL